MQVFRFTAASFAIALAMSGQIHAGESTDIVENDSLIAPEVQDVDDPFRRGLDRIADQATGGVELPSQQDPSGASRLGFCRFSIQVQVFRPLVHWLCPARFMPASPPILSRMIH